MQISNLLRVFLLSSKISDYFLFEQNMPANSHREGYINSGSLIFEDYNDKSRRPLVIWHGLGDNYKSPYIERVVEVLSREHPGMFIHVISLDEDPKTDERSTLFGNANDVVVKICEQLIHIKELNRGFDAIGFSQGGLFTRAVIERCPDLKVHNLITFGSPHMGVMDLPICSDVNDWICKQRNEFLKRQVWNSNVQKTIIPAQYFRDPYQLENYVLFSNFLADANNELVDGVKVGYRKSFTELENLVLVKFTEDTTLVPKGSAWFEDIDPVTDEVIPFRKTELYRNDLLGLKSLDRKERVFFFLIEADHMVLTNATLIEITSNFVGNYI